MQPSTPTNRFKMSPRARNIKKNSSTFCCYHKIKFSLQVIKCQCNSCYDKILFALFPSLSAERKQILLDAKIFPSTHHNVYSHQSIFILQLYFMSLKVRYNFTAQNAKFDRLNGAFLWHFHHNGNWEDVYFQSVFPLEHVFQSLRSSRVFVCKSSSPTSTAALHCAPQLFSAYKTKILLFDASFHAQFLQFAL